MSHALLAILANHTLATLLGAREFVFTLENTSVCLAICTSSAHELFGHSNDRGQRLPQLSQQKKRLAHQVQLLGSLWR